MTREPFRVEHAQELKLVRDGGFLGDGRHGYYVLAETVDDTYDRDSLWVFELDGPGRRRIATEFDDVRTPAAAPDGRSFALLAEVDGTRQIVVVPVDGGTSRALTALPQGVTGRPEWSPDGRFIAFTAVPAAKRDRSRPYRVDRATYRLDGVGYLDDAATDVHVVDVATGAVRLLTDDRAMNSDPRWSPDGRRVCYRVSMPADRPWTMLPELHLVEVETAESRVLVGKWGGVFAAEWCADGRIVFVGCPAGGRLWATGKRDLWTIDPAGGEPECRTEDVVPGVGVTVLTDLPICDDIESPRIRAHGDVAYVRAQVGGDAVVCRAALSGPERVDRVVEWDGSAYLLDVAPDGTVLHLATTLVDPPELMLGTERVTAFSDDLVERTIRPRVRTLRITAADGLRSDGWSLTPPDGDGPWPTVLVIHGGPYSSFGTTFMIDFQLLVSAGFAVVFHNFRGSGGYGSAFSRKMAGDWGTLGSLDHHAAVDAAIAAGIADPDRLGVYGLSYGGFATCWLVGTSDRFKAGVAENPVTNWATSVGQIDAEWWVVQEHGGTPQELPELYRERSPLTYAPGCRTPMLFIVGEADMRCTPIESEQYYRVLKTNGVTAEMLRLPGASHLGTYNGPVPARMAQNEALVEWFTRHLR